MEECFGLSSRKMVLKLKEILLQSYKTNIVVLGLDVRLKIYPTRE